MTTCVHFKGIVMASIYDWLYRTYYSLFFDTVDTLAVNLFLVVFGRVLYLIAFKINYGQIGKRWAISEEARDANRLVMTRAEIAWVIGRETAIIAVGMFAQAFALFFLAWSVLCVAQFEAGIIPRMRSKFLRVMGHIFRFLLYVLVGGAFAVYLTLWILDSDPYGPPGAIAIGAGIVIFLVKDLKVTRFTGEELRRFFSARRLAHFSRPAKVALIAGMVAAPVGFVLYLHYGAAPILNHYYIPSFDGTLLATDVYRSPLQSGPAPVILIRTPYGKDSAASVIGGYLGQNYVVVIQDTRGKFESGGNESRPFYYDALDGNATVNWILQQDFCNGNIATTGGSAVSIEQYVLAGANPRGLKFEDLVIGTPDLFSIMGFNGGAFGKAVTESWLYVQSFVTQSRVPYVDTYHEAIWNIFNHTTKDSYWAPVSLDMDDKFGNVSCWGLHQGGWYDIFTQGTLDGFVGYQYSGSPNAQGHQRMIIGPTAHGGSLDITYPTGTVLHKNWKNDMRSAALTGYPTINWADPCVAYYLMGDPADPLACNWRYANGWPLPHVNDTWYLQATGSLSNTAAGTDKNCSYIYDPYNPVPTVGGGMLGPLASVESDIWVNGSLDQDHTNNRLDILTGYGPKDQTLVLGRPDVLEFTTGVLTQAVETVGHIWANLWVATNCTDTAFTVKLMDVFPDGTPYNIVDGIQVLRRRAGPTAPDAPVVPNTPYNITVDCWSTAYRFAPGHRIKVAISSSNFPRFEIHPNSNDTFTNHPLQGNVYDANNTILVGATYPSSIYLPRLI